jgi:tRNA(Ile)-lysidine synthetase-like protein
VKVTVKTGKYVVAVSGGVDSVMLLDLLTKIPDLALTVAHFDHGIRPESADDRRFVQALATRHDLPFEYMEGRLGEAASEATARQARYDFLKKIQKQIGASAIITAHHQDDVLETAVINLLRGTGRKGLTALRNRPGIVRPLLKVPKTEILDYAQEHSLEWREDSTNLDITYLRNYIRHRLLPRLSNSERAQLVKIFTTLTVTNTELDELLADFIDEAGPGRLERDWFNQLPHEVAREVMATWLRSHELRGFDRRTLERLVVAAKTGRAGKTFPVMAGHHMRVGSEQLTLA